MRTINARQIADDVGVSNGSYHAIFPDVFGMTGRSQIYYKIFDDKKSPQWRHLELRPTYWVEFESYACCGLRI